MALRNAGLSLTDSARALMSSVNLRGSLTQGGIRPQRTSANCRRPSARRTIGYRLRRRHVVARRKVRLLRIAEQAPDRFRRGQRPCSVRTCRTLPSAANRFPFAGKRYNDTGHGRRTTAPPDERCGIVLSERRTAMPDAEILPRAPLSRRQRRDRARRQDSRGAARAAAGARPVHAARRRGRGRRDARRGGRARGPRGDRHGDRAGRPRRLSRNHRPRWG